jgi:hypothetical protein
MKLCNKDVVEKRRKKGARGRAWDSWKRAQRRFRRLMI